ncbi:MAG: hypothetical protein ACREIF_15680 [Chthoniobacterales bacterium]
MEPGEALGTAAQVSVALAGFAGVVVVFRTESVHQWSAIDKFRLRLLLGNSVVPLMLCLFGIFLLVLRPPPPGVWRWGSGFAAALLFPYGLLMGRAAGGIPPGQFPSDLSTRLIFYPLLLLGWAFNFLQLYNLIFLGIFWPFFAVIVFQLFAAVIQFVRLILLPYQSS